MEKLLLQFSAQSLDTLL